MGCSNYNKPGTGTHNLRMREVIECSEDDGSKDMMF